MNRHIELIDEIAKEVRNTSNFTSICEIAGVHRGTLSQWQSGRNGASLEKFCKIAEAAGFRVKLERI